MKTTETVELLVKDLVEGMGFELCDVEYQKEFGNWTLTLFIDKQGGVTIDDCEAVSRAVDPVLEKADPIEQAYYLSVSSLGLDRPLKKDRDFERSIGQTVELRLYAPLDGRKEYEGALTAYDTDSMTIATDGSEKRFSRKDVAMVRPKLVF